MMLEGRTAMVTGVGPGMGRDISLALANEGADVVLVARSEKVVPSVVEEIEAMGRRAFPVYGNIAKRDECERIAAEALAATSTLGLDRSGLDILVNSAFHGGEHTRFEDADLERWRRPVDINYFGTLQLTQAVLPQIKLAAERTGDARIVMINTMSVQRIEDGAGAYAGSKAALAAVTKTLAVELGEYGIRVNA
ncbi:MAG: SDR family NAD(P)-dependent oxidoreductase, partial [Acidobacteriota bacterium]|nr:SDR family NAD(P)-dependent oxidoreductase [Acidobacteriota bacterium]